MSMKKIPMSPSGIEPVTFHLLFNVVKARGWIDSFRNIFVTRETKCNYCVTVDFYLSCFTEYLTQQGVSQLVTRFVTDLLFNCVRE
jgi:hypothetical protein